MAAAAVGSNQFGLDSDLFTRGTGDDKSRGESMVQLHLQKLQKEKEYAALEKLGVLMPQTGVAVRVLALKETAWDVEQALSMLRDFITQNEEAVKVVQKKRRKIKEAAEAAAQAQQEAESSSDSDSDSSSSDSDSDSSSSSSDDEGSKKKRSSKKDKRSKRRKDSEKKKKKKKSSKDKKHKRSSKDKDKERGKKDQAKAGAQDFGKYGIIRETDAAAKRSEFILWALEVKKVDVESLARPDERELFKDYIEDYNTGTLPHRKYYNVEAYERAKAIKEMERAEKEGRKAAKRKATTVADDEREMRRKREEERRQLAEDRLKEAYAQLQFTNKAADMKEQEMLRLQMQQAYKTGDVAKAKKLQELLAPDDPAKVKK